MPAVGAIVVRSAERLAGYRDAARSGALVLDQIARPPRVEERRVLAVVLPLCGAFFASALHPALATPALALAAGVAATSLVAIRSAMRPKARLVVDAGWVRVLAPSGRVVTALRAREVLRLEVEAIDVEHDALEIGWSIVAHTEDGPRALLESGDQTAALRVRTLLVERLAREGAWSGIELALATCPACRARIALPPASLPSAIACARCGERGTLVGGGRGV